MFGLIVFIIFGALIAYFATQNTARISLEFAGSVLRDIPIYAVILCSILVGLILAWIASAINAFSSMMDMMGKKKAIKEKEITVEELKSRIHDLELENAAVRAEHKRIAEEKGSN